MKAASAEPRILGEVELPAVRESVSLARAEVRRWLGDGAPVVDDVVLLVSELVTNAVTHSGAGPGDFIGLIVSEAGGILYVEVTDPGSPLHGPRVVEPDGEEHGRGLLIVQEVALGWGSSGGGESGARTVWCAVRGEGLSAGGTA